MQHKIQPPAALTALNTLFVTLFLTACGGGDDDTAQAAPAAAATPTTTVSGRVVKGPVASSQVCGYALAANARGPAVGSCTTSDASGNYTLTVPVGSGPLWVEATGGSYVDEITAAITSLPAGSALSALVTANGGAVTSMLTPLTTLALNAARSGGTLDATAFAAASAQVLASFNLPATLNISTTAPVFGSGIDAYGTALTTISRMVGNGSTLASILAATTPSSLAAAYAAAGASPAPTTPPTPTTPPATPGTTSASGTVTATGSAVAGSITPMATGFQVTVEREKTRYEFSLSPVSVAGFATATSTASVAVERSATGAIYVAYADPRVQLTPATCDARVSTTTCGVVISTPAGATHPVTLTFTNTPLVGGGVLNGTLVGDASGARWNAAELPRTTDGALGVNGASVVVTTGSSNGGVTGGNTVRAYTLNLADGSLISLSQVNNEPVSVTRVVQPSTFQTCTSGCNVSFTDSANGTAIAFGGTPLSGGVTLTNSVFVGKTTGTLTASGSLGSFTPTADSFKSSNDSLILVFNNLGTPGQAGLSLFSITVRGGRVTEIQATTGIASALYGCGDTLATLGYPVCSGITLAPNSRTVTFADAVLSGGAIGAAKTSVTFNGTLTAKGE